MRGRVKRSSIPSYGLGILLFAFVVVASERWTPFIWFFFSDQLDKHEWAVKLVFYGLSILVILISKYWDFRRRPILWVGLAALVIVNLLAIRLFISIVRQLATWHYVIIIICEMFISMVFLEWCLGRKHRSLRY
jgi:hypothetical protein